MAYTMEYADQGRTLVVVSEFPLAATHPALITLAQLLDAVHQKVPLASFGFEVVSQQPAAAVYVMNAADGRTWKQHILLEKDAPMNFEVPGHWRVSEFSAHRPLRDHVIQAAMDLHLQSISCQRHAQGG